VNDFMDSVHHIWCPLSSQEYQDLPDGAETTLTGELTEQNDMFRLTYALETAKDMGWNYRVMSDREWAGRYALVLNPGVNGVYLLRTNLDAAFDDNGQQTNPLTVRLTGNVTGIMKLLNRCGWQAEPESDASLPHQFSLMARQGVPGKGD
ncbi:TPA: hypothetical protein ACOJ3T_005306, partial [Klebsiella pneumoniae]